MGRGWPLIQFKAVVVLMDESVAVSKGLPVLQIKLG